MKNISIGYFELQNQTFISGKEINGNLLRLLSHYARVEFIPVKKDKDIKKEFLLLKKRKFDYIYVNSFCFLEESFLLRERFNINIPFILNLHTAFRWANDYAFIIPLIRKYDVLIAPCEFAKKSFSKICNQFRISVIPRFYDTRFIQDNIALQPDDSKKIITFLGRLIKRKGAELLIDCMPAIIKKVKNAHLYIIGPLSKNKTTDYPKAAYVRMLQKKARGLNLSPIIHFTGLKTGLDKFRLISRSHAFVNPTTAKEESLSSTNIEALICGVPVITTDWAGNSELIKNGYNGFLINVRNQPGNNPAVSREELISRMLLLLKNKRLNNKMRHNALTTARRYDYRRLVPRLVKLLRKQKANPKKRNRWEIIKHKKPADFRENFSKDFLFFINFYYNAKHKTYASLYKELIQEKAVQKNKTFPVKYSRADKQLLKNLREDFFNFLKPDNHKK